MKRIDWENINRKLHIHLGLLMLLFIWLFSLSGLILNHGGWKFTSFWEAREESLVDFNVPLSLLDNPKPQMIVMDFLNLSGEMQPMLQTVELLEFRVHSPGLVNDVKVDLISGLGSKKTLQNNAWGKWRTLHTFNGMNKENISQTPNWWITNIWRFTMDGIAIALMIICVSSWIMWHRIRKEFRMGIVVLASSFLIVGYILFWS
jgi:hypothetical protein